MVRKKRMAGIAFIVLGLILGMMAFILDLVTTGKIKFGQTPLYLFLGGLMISFLGAIYIGAGTTEAVRLLSKQVKIMKGELAEKDKTISEQKKGIESMSDSRLTGLSQTVDRLDMMKKEEAKAEKEEKLPEAPPKPAWEKKPDKPAETLPPPPPKSMVAHAPAKPAVPIALPLPPPPPKSMQVSSSQKPIEHHMPKPAEALTPPPPVETPKPAPVVPVPVPVKTEAAVTAPPKPAEKEELIEEPKDEIDEENLLPSMTCPKCGNTFRGDWEHCPFCDYNLKTVPKAEASKPVPAAASGGLSILGYTPKKDQPAKAEAQAPPAPPVEKMPEPPKPAAASTKPPVSVVPRTTAPPAPSPPQPVLPPRPQKPTTDKCSSCGKSVKSHWRNCPYCKAILKE
jgi:hypothetical protein